jgi:dTDP-glucose 4,6-dehydratase
LIPLCITNLLYGKSLPVYGDGKNIRDWLYVEDHCRGIDLILKHGKIGESYNIGGENEWDNLSLVKLLCQKVDAAFHQDSTLQARFPSCPSATGIPCTNSIKFVTDRAGHDRRYAICSERIVMEMSYRPSLNFEDGLSRTIDWYLQNEDWWKPLLIHR